MVFFFSSLSKFSLVLFQKFCHLAIGQPELSDCFFNFLTIFDPFVFLVYILGNLFPTFRFVSSSYMFLLGYCQYPIIYFLFQNFIFNRIFFLFPEWHIFTFLSKDIININNINPYYYEFSEVYFSELLLILLLFLLKIYLSFRLQAFIK